MVITEFLTVASVELVEGESCGSRLATDPGVADRCSLTGFERHGGALILLAALTAVMAWGAGVGASRPAAFALIGLGAVVLVWTLLVDLPTTNETGGIGPLYANAKAQTGPGLYTELIAGLLAAGAGGVRLLRPG
jgi:O-antigen ligase